MTDDLRRTERLPAELLKRVTPAQIAAAVARMIAGETPPGFGPSTDFDLLTFEGVRLPPKAVFGLAASLALDFDVRPQHFTSGEGSLAFRLLRAANYEIVPKSGSATQSLIQRLASEINAAAKGYEIGGLQRLRARLRGYARPSGSAIFSDRSTTPNWAFHSGGRDELQFNIGTDVILDDEPAVRAGVAFSLETSLSLPDISVLEPAIRRFNEIMRSRPEAFSDMAMWHYRNDYRSPDRAPGPIEAELFQPGVFIFLGLQKPVDAADAGFCLETFDRLFDLYREVQGDLRQVDDAQPAISEVLRLTSGVDARPTGWTTATYAERTCNIYLRHNEMQNRLRAALAADGLVNSSMEVRLGLRAIDLVAEVDGELWFYEVKTATTVRQCLREALGQLLEYALWPGATRPARLTVVGEPALDADAEAYLARLNTQFPVPIYYQQISLA